MKILFIGNSYTYFNDMEKIFEALCRENEKDVEALRITGGGRKMIQYADPEDLAALTHYNTLFGSFPENTASLLLSDSELNTFKAVIGN